MPRTVNPTAHAVRRDTFLDAAQRLIQSRGYEQMSVQDILEEMGASRGAFYHYFDSKAALLDAVVERMVVAGMAAVAPIVAAPELSAPEKLVSLFAGIARFKSERKELLRALLNVWYSDDNALLRDKLRRRETRYLLPPLDAIVSQGEAEGSFTVPSPDAARVIMAILQGASDAAVELFLARQNGGVSFDDVVREFSAYTRGLERILGVPPESLTIIDEPTLREWFG